MLFKKHVNQKQLRNKLSCFFLVLSLFACSTNKTIEQTTTQLEFTNTAIDPYTYITSIGDENFTDHDYSPNKIQTQKLTVHCEAYTIGQLGRIEVPVIVNGKELFITFEVVDTTAPYIESDDTYTVEQDNAYFDLRTFFTVYDEFDETPFIGIEGAYDVSVPGTYPLALRTKDKSRIKRPCTKDVYKALWRTTRQRRVLKVKTRITLMDKRMDNLLLGMYNIVC